MYDLAKSTSKMTDRLKKSRKEREKSTKDQEAEVMRLVHTTVRSAFDDLRQRNTYVFEAELGRTKEVVTTRVRLEEQYKLKQIVATMVKKAKGLLKDEVWTDLEQEMRQI